MNLLAIDSACSILSAAVSRGEEIFYEETESGMKQSEFVMDIIDSLMKKAGLKPDDLDGMLCMGGPGSFTGLRIGYSIAKGLALSLSKPFAPVPTLECVSFETQNDELLLAVIEARKNACFYAFFKNGKRVTEDRDGDYARIADEIEKHSGKIILKGYGALSLYNSLPQNLKEKIIFNFEKKGCAKELIYYSMKNNLFDNDNSAFLFSGPEYIRKTDAELKNPV